MSHELKISIPKYDIDDLAHPSTWKHPAIDEVTQFYDVRIHISFEAALTLPALAHSLRDPPTGCMIPEAYLERMNIPFSTREFWIVRSLHGAED